MRPVPGFTTMVDCVRAVLQAEQRGTTPTSVVAPDLPGPESRAVVDLLVAHRLVTTVGPHAAALGLPESAAASLARADRLERLTALAMLADVLTVNTALTRSGVAHLLLKGAALAVVTTGNPLARGAGDVDILVDPADITRAVTALAAVGIAPDPTFCPAPGTALFRPTQRVLQEMLLLADGHEVDLHWRLDIAAGALRWPVADLLAASVDIPVGASRARTLGPAHTAIFNASHAAKDSWSTLRAVVDQVRAQRGLDLAALREQAYRASAGRRLDLAQAMIGHLLGEDPGYRIDPALRWTARRIWGWLARNEPPRDRRDPTATVRSLAVNLGTYDDLGDACSRAATLVWPVREMAAGTLGSAGERHPWLYPAATPYFLPRRFLAKSGSR